MENDQTKNQAAIKLTRWARRMIIKMKTKNEISNLMIKKRNKYEKFDSL